MQKTINVTAFALVSVLAFVIVGQFMDAKAQEISAKASYVQQVCNKALDGDTAIERAQCGIAEQKANAEYLCNGDFATDCWVEVK